jgi:hypothetical protein
MNVPFTGPGLPLATKAKVSDGLLDVVCFEVDRRRELEKWLDAPHHGPVTVRQGKVIELSWKMSPTASTTKPTAIAKPNR